MDIVKILLTIFLPPVAAFMQVGPTLHFWANIVLTLLGGLPGMVHAVWLVVTKKQFARRPENTGSGHTEALQMTFNPQKVSVPELLDVFWRNINPVDPDGQFVDRDSQYRPAIFYHDQEQQKLAKKSLEDLAAPGRFKSPLEIEIVPLESFYTAEDHHHDYYQKSPVQYNAYRYNSGRDQLLKNSGRKRNDVRAFVT